MKCNKEVLLRKLDQCVEILNKRVEGRNKEIKKVREKNNKIQEETKEVARHFLQLLDLSHIKFKRRFILGKKEVLD